jgi:hypothetical protein
MFQWITLGNDGKRRNGGVAEFGLAMVGNSSEYTLNILQAEFCWRYYYAGTSA